jgi:hypothetical protein
VFHQLVNRNDDLRRLLEKGYAIAFDSKCLIVRDIPYLDAGRNLQHGAFVTKLVFVDNELVTQDNHQVFFAGGVPHGLDGRPIPHLGDSPAQFPLSDTCRDVVVQRAFSNKPSKTGAYRDFFHKIETYVALISGPAIELHGADPLTFRSVQSIVEDSVFKIHDTLTSRAEIGDLAAKFRDDVIAVIGVGGTGAYLLDLLVRTPVREIRAFDHDDYHVHTAFRSPGRIDPGEFGRPKADVYFQRYDNLRKGLSVSRRFIDALTEAELDRVTFAFVCVDNGLSRAGIFDLLLAKRIPFIDVGLGLDRKRGPLDGQLRATFYSAENGTATRQMGLAELVEHPDNMYRTNVQVGELNALNACLAIIKFKQIRGFYFQNDPLLFHVLFNLGNLKVFGESKADDDRAAAG